MSYTVSPYLLKIDDLKKVVGSNDQTLFTAVLKNKAEEDGDVWEEEPEENDECVDDDNDNEEDDDENIDDEDGIKQAICAIINGDLNNENIEPYQYGYALEVICQYLGEREFIEALESVRGSWTFNEMWSWILESKPPVPIPDDGDFPCIGHLYHADIQKELDRTNALDFSNRNEKEQEMYTEIRESLVELYETAIKEQFDIMTFYY
jgi:hypothetical protein